jgi:bacteriorhodopsin
MHSPYELLLLLTSSLILLWLAYFVCQVTSFLHGKQVDSGGNGCVTCILEVIIRSNLVQDMECPD